METMDHVDVCVAGAGIIGLSLALELRRRGRSVMVLEKGHAMRESSWAAAGMLAADDPELPSALREMAHLSVDLYPEFLNRIRSLSGHSVPVRTVETLLGAPLGSAHGVEGAPAAPSAALPPDELKAIEPILAPGNYAWKLIREASVNPRDLCVALPAALATPFQNVVIRMLEMAEWLPPSGPAESTRDGYVIHTPLGDTLATNVVDCRGAWADLSGDMGISGPTQFGPRKGQALSIELPAGMRLTRTIRTNEVYIVPRGDGRALIGATLEEAGYDKSVDDASIAALVASADVLVPGIAQGTILERWAGLRPLSADGLPVIGAVPGRPGCFIASGHFWDGILLAPATAHLMAQLICGETPSICLDAFDPARFCAMEAGNR